MPYQFSSGAFTKKCSTQHAVIAMIEKAWKILEKGGTFGALLTDLSKVFDCMIHNVLIVKFHVMNFDMNPLNLIFDYLTGRKQRELIPVLAHIWIYFIAYRKDQFWDCYSMYFSVIYFYLLRKLILWITQMITLRLLVLKMLTSLWKD